MVYSMVTLSVNVWINMLEIALKAEEFGYFHRKLATNELASMKMVQKGWMANLCSSTVQVDTALFKEVMAFQVEAPKEKVVVEKPHAPDVTEVRSRIMDTPLNSMDTTDFKWDSTYLQFKYVPNLNGAPAYIVSKSALIEAGIAFSWGSSSKNVIFRTHHLRDI